MKNRPTGLTYTKPQNELMNKLPEVYKIWIDSGRPKQCKLRTILISKGFKCQQNITGTLNRLKAIDNA